MIDIRKLKELVKLMVANDLSEMDLRDTDEQVTIRRQGDTVVTVPAQVAVAAPVAAPAAAPVVAPVVAPVASNALVDEGVEIASPMVGTFYVSQDPDSPPFVSVGDSITEDSTVCVIEAMKIFNEINAQCKGTVIKVLVANGDPVEFGQALFLVKPQ